MRATCLVCTLKRSPEASNSEALAEVVLGALRDEGVETDVIRLADHQIDFGVVSEAVSDGDEWPGIRDRILASDILIMAIPTWLGQPSSVSKVALERMDASSPRPTTTARRRSPETPMTPNAGRPSLRRTLGVGRPVEHAAVGRPSKDRRRGGRSQRAAPARQRVLGDQGRLDRDPGVP